MSLTIAETLRQAAEYYLWDGEGEYAYGNDGRYMYSCDAVYWSKDFNKNWGVFLEELGVLTWSTSQFNEFPAGPVRQAARYAWLLFAADIAEEWGV